MTYIIAFRNISNSSMPMPIVENGALVTFPTDEAAKLAAGWDGTSTTESWDRILELCERHGLNLPEMGAVQLTFGGMA